MPVFLAADRRYCLACVSSDPADRRNCRFICPDVWIDSRDLLDLFQQAESTDGRSSGNLDSKNSSEVIALLHEASKKYAQTIIMITHSQSIAQTADRVLKVSDGVLTDLGRCQA